MQLMSYELNFVMPSEKLYYHITIPYLEHYETDSNSLHTRLIFSLLE